MSKTKLLEALSLLPENIFTNDILIPLIQKLHPGKIEYTHSNIEAGRDIISIGQDCLNRQHVLCIQVKATQISYGAKFSEVVGVCELAKREGVTLENGNKSHPDEVWYVSSQVFPEPSRRQVADSISELNKQGIKIVSAEEIAYLLTESLPDIVYKLLEVTSDEVKNIISKLSRHFESRAFDLPKDKYLETFFVDIDVCPTASEYVWNYITEKIAVPNLTLDITTRSSINEATRFNDKISILESDKENLVLASFLKKYQIDFSIRIIDSIEKISKKNVIDERVRGLIDIEIAQTLKDLRKHVKEKINICPEYITQDNTVINEILFDFSKIKRIIDFYISKGKSKIEKHDLNNIVDPEMSHHELRIKLNKPCDLLNLSDRLLIEGNAGHGKTTLLRMIAIDLLETGEKALYMPCFALKKERNSSSLLEILKKNAWLDYPEKWKENEVVLLLDGLDESTEDLSEIILQGSSKFKKIIVSARHAYQTPLRSIFPTISLSKFSEESRQLFFDKWFKDSAENINIVKELCQNYPDIDLNSRIPLLATIIAVLIENGYKPTNRVELYDYRLNLLLWKWDQARGIRRNIYTNIEAKKRFLIELAYSIHSKNERIIDNETLRNVYEASLGNYGYDIDYDVFIKDLVVNNGVLFKDMNNCYSFGHLSFQEHLVGIYLYEKLNISEIIPFLDNIWWKDCLLFYAAYKKDITDLISKALGRSLFSSIDTLKIMCTLAPFTSPGAIDILNNEEN